MAILHFSDNSTLELQEGDFIVPISYINEADGDSFSSMAKPVELINHIDCGLTPSILNAFTQCDFFYINHNYKSAYNSKTIVRIELV